MRLRNDPKAKIILEQNREIYKEWNEGDEKIVFAKVFGNSNPTYLEIGMGKGQFIIGNAALNPNINYLGLEKNTVICSKAVKKFLSLEKKISNLRILNLDASKLLQYFEPNSIDKLFLNFSDPWPKARHAKNRLTNHRFLELYKSILKQNGLIEMKTDNESLYAYSLEVIQESPLVELIYTTNDLYRDINHSDNIGNIATEYEERFSKVKNINKIIFKFK
ncbi:MAG: tRNA (guanosine(46)-N7)-methyltransferase TrmB [Mycoplasma sp.]